MRTKYTRRTLFSLAASLALPALPSGAVAQRRVLWLPGLQLFTVRDLLERDRDATLRLVAEAGYRIVETAGLAGAAPQAMRANLQRYGLAAPSMHVGYEELVRDLDASVAAAKVLGAEFLVCPSIDAEQRATLDDWRRVCQTLSRTALALRNHGLSLAYHNHDFEFTPLADGAVPFDVMVRETDPRDVGLELDVYWVAKAGRDPLQCLKENRDRVRLLHLKDLGVHGTTVELGRGVVNFEPIIRAALAAGVKHLFVEQDDSSNPLASIRASFEFLQRLPQDVRPQGRG